MSGLNYRASCPGPVNDLLLMTATTLVLTGERGAVMKAGSPPIPQLAESVARRHAGRLGCDSQTTNLLSTELSGLWRGVKRFFLQLPDPFQAGCQPITKELLGRVATNSFSPLLGVLSSLPEILTIPEPPITSAYFAESWTSRSFPGANLSAFSLQLGATLPDIGVADILPMGATVVHLRKGPRAAFQPIPPEMEFLTEAPPPPRTGYWATLMGVERNLQGPVATVPRERLTLRTSSGCLTEESFEPLVQAELLMERGPGETGFQFRSAVSRSLKYDPSKEDVVIGWNEDRSLDKTLKRLYVTFPDVAEWPMI